ncbi:NDP-sugar synthase [Saccharicrinis sp. FJH62]|uniref:nucleotidyltransferase family protein n=1 Tax=Saccharicrinis sp. FJH62 TaxID=3344657 RepID=UPI0035D41EA2
MKPTLVILAAGMGSRYGGLKQIDGFGPNEEAIIEYSVFDAIRAGFGKVVFVVRESIEEAFKAHFGSKFEGKIDVEYVYQELDIIPAGLSVPAERTKPWGTGHAVLVAKDAVKTPFAVINADDFYGRDAFETVARELSATTNEAKTYFLLGYEVQKTLSDFGSVSRGVCSVDNKGNLADIVERTKIYKDSGKIVYDENGSIHELAPEQPVSMNFMAFTPSAFTYYEAYFNEFIKANVDNPKAEFYMPTVLNTLISKGEAEVKVLSTTAQWFGVTYKEDKEDAVAKLNQLIADGEYPSKLW